MAIICAICGRKQSGWIEDFPLSSNMTEQRICAKCHEKLEKILNSPTPENEKDSMSDLEIHLEAIAAQEVQEYLEEVILRAPPHRSKSVDKAGQKW